MIQNSLELQPNSHPVRRFQSLAIVVLALLGTSFSSERVTAETVMEKIQRTGTVTAGTSQEAPPFAFANERGELQGYSVAMLQLIQSQLSRELGRDIELKLVALNPNERIPALAAGQVDLVCDASSYTWEREKQIDFSISYAQTGTRLLVKKDSGLRELANLADQKIAAVAGTTNELAIRRAQPQAQLLVVKDHAEGYAAFERGSVDAFAADGILLNSWLYSSGNLDNYELVGYFSKEGIACMMPENNSKFVDLVDYSLVRFMQGYLESKQPYVAIFERWFGTEAPIPLTQDLRMLIIETMQLAVDFKEELPESEL